MTKLWIFDPMNDESGTFFVFRQEKMSLGQKPPGDITQLLKFITQKSCT